MSARLRPVLHERHTVQDLLASNDWHTQRQIAACISAILQTYRVVTCTAVEELPLFAIEEVTPITVSQCNGASVALIMSCHPLTRPIWRTTSSSTSTFQTSSERHFLFLLCGALWIDAHPKFNGECVYSLHETSRFSMIYDCSLCDHFDVGLLMFVFIKPFSVQARPSLLCLRLLSSQSS